MGFIFTSTEWVAMLIGALVIVIAMISTVALVRWWDRYRGEIWVRGTVSADDELSKTQTKLRELEDRIEVLTQHTNYLIEQLISCRAENEALQAQKNYLSERVSTLQGYPGSFAPRGEA